MKKVISKLFSLLMICTLTFVLAACGSCSPDEEIPYKTNFTYDETKPNSTVLKEGYISLENENANGEIDEQGYYTVAGQRIKTKSVYKTYYINEPKDQKFNYLTNTWTYNSEHYTNMVDGLVENDKYGNLVGALAVGYKQENINGKDVWTFQLKEGVAWVDNKTGQVVSEVKAQNFVDALAYVLNPSNASGTVGIVTNLIDGSYEYYNAYAKILAKENAQNKLANGDKLSDAEKEALKVEITAEMKEQAKFENVGVKAIDDYTVQYTLYGPTPYFLSSLTYSPFLPVDYEYVKIIGTEFGSDENHILVNGAFRITEHEFETIMIYEKNENYYDKAHVYVEKVEKLYYASTNDENTARKWFEKGYIDSFTVRLDGNDVDGYNKYVAGEDGTGTVLNPASELCNPILSVGDATYIGYFNYNRTYFEYNDSSLIKTAAEKQATTKAVVNKNFRKGFLYGLDVLTYLTMHNASAPYEWLMRGYTNRELVSFSHTYNGINVTDYADIVDIIYNEKQGTNGVSLSGINQGGDPIFDEIKARAYLEKAKIELLASGLSASDFPIKVDFIGNQVATIRNIELQMLNRFNNMAEGIVEIRINVPNSDDQDSDWGSLYSNFDFSMWSGWGPDYADPSTYLHTCVVGGDLVEYFGFGTAETSELENEILGAYTALYDKANAITDPTKLAERYYAFAEAEYHLIYEDAIIIPWLTQSGYSASVSRTIPWQAGRASYGLTSDKLKNVIVSDSIITKEIRNAITEAYKNGK